jgi:hypothetical protein
MSCKPAYGKERFCISKNLKNLFLLEQIHGSCHVRDECIASIAALGVKITEANSEGPSLGLLL